MYASAARSWLCRASCQQLLRLRVTMSCRGHVGLCNSEMEEAVARKMQAKLHKAGFSECRSCNALASTGYVHESRAGEWLLLHTEDADADTDMSREIYVFLCPVGNLLSSVLSYWQDCRKVMAWNAAMEYPPHITLVPPFEVPCSKVLLVHKILGALTRRFLNRALPDRLPLKVYQNLDPNFMGYIVPAPSKNILDEFTDEAIADLDKGGIHFPAEVLNKRKGIYHLSLAYGYSTGLGHDLNMLMERWFPTSLMEAHCEWEIRVYSRDARLCNYKDVETYEMQSSRDDLLLSGAGGEKTTRELSYTCGDHVALLGASESLRHGWALGLHMENGDMGDFMPLRGYRVPQSHCWCLHRVWRFRNTATNTSNNGLPPSETLNDAAASANLINRSLSFDESGTNVPVADGMNGSNSTAAPSSNKSTEQNAVRRASSLKLSPFSSSSASSSSSESRPRRVLVMRHGERMDMCFSKAWISRCFDSKGVYRPVNLNMPPTLPAGRPQADFQHDSPLTQLGHMMAHITGQGLATAGITIDFCYTSPALRCIETATEVLRGCHQTNTPIRVEPLLFEWLGWYGNRLPAFMSLEKLKQAGFNVDLGYKAVSSSKEYKMTETIEKYCERTAKVVKKIMENHKRKGVFILIVGHAGSLDTCTRPLVDSARFTGTSFSLSSSWNRSKLRSTSDGDQGASSMSATSTFGEEFCRRASRVPYCGLAMAEEIRGGKWHLVQPPVPPLTHGNNPEFDWRSLACW